MTTTMPVTTKCHCAGVASLFVLASLPLLHWHLLCIFTATVLASLLSLHWRCCPCRTGIVAVFALALLPSLHWHLCPHCADVITLVTNTVIVLVSLSLMHWHHCPRCAGIVAPPANACGLSTEEKDILLCSRVGRWPLLLPSCLCVLPSCLCVWPLN